MIGKGLLFIVICVISNIFFIINNKFKKGYDNEKNGNNNYENDFIIEYDEKYYFRALDSLVNETDESDIELDDTQSELSEFLELNEENSYQVIGHDTISKL